MRINYQHRLLNDEFLPKKLQSNNIPAITLLVKTITGTAFAGTKLRRCLNFADECRECKNSPHVQKLFPVSTFGDAIPIGMN